MNNLFDFIAHSPLRLMVLVYLLLRNPMVFEVNLCIEATSLIFEYQLGIASYVVPCLINVLPYGSSKNDSRSREVMEASVIDCGTLCDHILTQSNARSYLAATRIIQQRQ